MGTERAKVTWLVACMKEREKVGGLTVGDLGVAPQGGLIAGGDAKNSRVPLEIFHAILDSVVVRYVALQPTCHSIRPARA